MTVLAFTELLGGRVFEIADLDDSTLTDIGGSVLAGPAGPSRDAAGAVAVAEMNLHEIAVAEPGLAWSRFGTHGSGVGEFIRPVATGFLSGGQLLVLDAGNYRLARFADMTGTGWTVYGHAGRPTPGDVAEGAYADPRGLAVDTSDRIWVSDPGANRVTRIDSLDGSGWTQIPLPAAANPPIPYGICAYQQGVIVFDVANLRLLIIDADGATSTVDLNDGTWVSPCFVAALDDDIAIADVVANEMRLLELNGAGYTVTARLRGSPPDVLDPLFDSLGGIGS